MPMRFGTRWTVHQPSIFAAPLRAGSQFRQLQLSLVVLLFKYMFFLDFECLVFTFLLWTALPHNTAKNLLGNCIIHYFHSIYVRRICGPSAIVYTWTGPLGLGSSAVMTMSC